MCIHGSMRIYTYKCVYTHTASQSLITHGTPCETITKQLTPFSSSPAFSTLSDATRTFPFGRVRAAQAPDLAQLPPYPYLLPPLARRQCPWQ